MTEPKRGWVSVGVDHDTAVRPESLRRWWQEMGQWLSGARRLLVILTGGSNGYRSRCGKWHCRASDDLGLRISVCHFRPARASGTRSSTDVLLHHQELRGKPLRSRAVVVN